jgi:hypothetical protein
MTPSQTFMLPKRSRDAFWGVVKNCLREFHNQDEVAANDLAERLRRKIENPPRGLSSDIFYHAEPFDVANDLAGGNPVELAQVRAQYEKILERHDW